MSLHFNKKYIPKNQKFYTEIKKYGYLPIIVRTVALSCAFFFVIYVPIMFTKSIDNFILIKTTRKNKKLA